MTTTRSAQGNGLIQRLAAAWIQELGLQGFVGHPETIFAMPGLISRIKRLCPATLGMIAASCAERRNAWTHLHVQCCAARWRERSVGQRKRVSRCLARTAMAAEIFDQLGQPYEDHHARMERLRAEEEFDRAERDYVHHGGNTSARVRSAGEIRDNGF